MFRTMSQAFKRLHCSSVSLSARMFGKGADNCALAGKVAVVTGSTKGIGFAIARRLAQDGAHVVISSRKQQNVDEAVATLLGKGLSVTGTVCHVGKAEDREHLVAKALEHSGGVDFLVCVAGVNPWWGALWEPVSRSGTRGGSVILVSSITAYMPLSNLGVYNTSKTALLGLSKSLAVELASKGIRVNCLVPGIINTDFSQVMKIMPNLLPKMNELYGLQRFGEPEECAGIVSFLCSPDATYITGENFVVAGFSPKL